MKSKDDEFKGFVKARLEDINENLKRLNDNYSKHLEKCDARFCRIEETSGKTNVSMGKMAVVYGAISVVASIIFSQIVIALFKGG